MMLGIPGQHQQNPSLTGHLRDSHDNRDEACSYTPTFTVAIRHRGPGQVMAYPEYCCMTLIPHTSSTNSGIFVNIFAFLRLCALNINILYFLFSTCPGIKKYLKYLAALKYAISHKISDNNKYHNEVVQNKWIYKMHSKLLSGVFV